VQSFLKVLGIIFLSLIILSVIGGLIRYSGGASSRSEANVAVIEIEGVISESLPVLEKIQHIKESDAFRAVVVRVNSPGGAVGASQEIFLELKKLKADLPVVISMGDIAASGGLYVSLGGQRVFALPGTLTGSMGVVFQLTQFHRLLDRLSIDPVTLKSGALKDAGNPTTPLPPATRDFLQSLIQSNFETFKKDVQTERSLKPEAVQALSDGRVVEGVRALELGLVDELGTFQDAVDFAAKTAGIAPADVALDFVMRKPKPWWEIAITEALVRPLLNEMKKSSFVPQYLWELSNP
jgi:protease-4